MNSELLKITNNQGKTIYNPTIPFKYEDKTYIGIRVESFESELDSKTKFAYKNYDDNSWIIDESIKSLPLQDPAHIKIKDETFILGVKVWREDKKIKWKQEIYRGKTIRDLHYFTSGPIGMKDIRLVDLEDRIGVFTRPQGEIGGKGKIGYLEVKDINELESFSEKDWYGAKIIEGLFGDGYWGGVNQAINLGKGRIGIIGHNAYQTINRNGENEKHYRVISFVFDTKLSLYSNYKIISKREDFPKSHSKRSPELDDILFPAGILPINEKKAKLFVGISDVICGKRIIINPFL